MGGAHASSTWMAVDQQGGRSDGAIPVDGKPGTVNGGEEQDLPHIYFAAAGGAVQRQNSKEL